MSKNFQKTDGKLRKIFKTYTKKVVSLTYKDPLEIKIKKTKFTGRSHANVSKHGVMSKSCYHDYAKGTW